jgi:hypothetical protein
VKFVHVVGALPAFVTSLDGLQVGRTGTGSAFHHCVSSCTVWSERQQTSLYTELAACCPCVHLSVLLEPCLRKHSYLLFFRTSCARLCCLLVAGLCSRFLSAALWRRPLIAAPDDGQGPLPAHVPRTALLCVTFAYGVVCLRFLSAALWRRAFNAAPDDRPCHSRPGPPRSCSPLRNDRWRRSWSQQRCWRIADRYTSGQAGRLCRQRCGWCAGDSWRVCCFRGRSWGGLSVSANQGKSRCWCLC